MNRRLAAIMFTDMVGYTALAQRDESLALTLLEEQRQLVRPILVRHNGREIKTIGNAFLIDFPSALDAVRCGYDIQRAVRELNFSLAPEKRLLLRVGIHLGDVVSYTNDIDISGDAVNVASRIEPLAEAGGICLTRPVYESVRGKFDLEMQSIGQKPLKNVSNPIEVFKVVMPWTANEERMKEIEPDRKRIAILPFRNMSPDPSDEYFAEGMTEELITTLAKIRELTVIARTSIMQYKNSAKRVTEISKELGVGTLIEGSVRKSGDKIRITIQLLDARTEGHLWAENFDNKLVDDVFAIQSEIAEKVTEELRVQLAGQEKNRIEEAPTTVTAAYMFYLKGRHFWNERTTEAMEKALLYFQESIKQDPKFAPSYAGIADCYGVMGRNGQTEYIPAYEKSKEYTKIALELDDHLAEAHTTRAATLHYYDHDWKTAETEFKRAIELKPSYSTAHQWYSHLLAQQGRLSEAEREIRRALELDPYSSAINHNTAALYYFLREYDKSIEHFNGMKELFPSELSVYVGPGPSLIRAYVQKKQFDLALAEVGNLAKLTKRREELKLWTAYVHSAMGDMESARKLIEEVEQDYKSENISPYEIGTVYFLLGDVDAGFKWLEIAEGAHDGNVNMMALDVELTPVRNDPRYFANLKKVGLSN
jgi:adenylate cyclase